MVLVLNIKMPLFRINSSEIKNNCIKISGDDVHHIVHSLRIKKNQIVKFTDSRYIYSGKIIEISKKYLIAEIVKSEKVSIQKKIDIVLCVALIKFENFEKILRWGTALGVSQFYPVQTQYSQKIEISSNRWQRWKKIIKESAIQSENPCPPELCEVMELKESFNILNSYFKIMLHPYTECNLKEILKENRKKIALYIGSEAGFTEDEIKMAIENNVKIAKLSGNILRTEIAALVAVSNILFFYE